jgi:hypothetical protein
MSKNYSEAIEAQQYTPKFIAGVCGNCTHMERDKELPAWMQKQPGVWDDKYKLEKNHRCGIGGFPVKKLGSCSEHAFRVEEAGA